MAKGSNTSNFEAYLRDLQEIRATGAAVQETSYYGALEKLLNGLGNTLNPKVRCVMQLKNTGAGMPDGGLYTARQFQKKTDDRPVEPGNPERGVIEIKGTRDDAWVTAATPQVSKYWNQYRQVLVTNYRDFVLIGENEQGEPAILETYRLAQNEAEFWQKIQNPKTFAQEHGEQVSEYLKRVMLQSARIATPKDLAWLLASYAKDARARLDQTDVPALASLRKALEEALGITFTGDKKDPQKGERFFKSTLVQTLFYGIFSAWVLWHQQDGRDRFDWEKSARYLHVPMLAALFHRFADIRHLKSQNLLEVLDWTASALNRVDRASFFAKFEEEQAVQYFYEPFLEAFDPKLRKEYGVWYTPPEVVRYMVARVDTVLRQELNIAEGLANPNVYILDPCCGTGAFLVEVLHRIKDNLQEDGAEALLGAQLKEAAMSRVFGFELLTAPFVVAHLQLGLLLQQLGVPLADDDERVGVYLTNALTGWEPSDPEKERFLQLQLASMPELQEERDAAAHIKQSQKILVILGNPPYDGFAGVAVGEERELSQAYRKTKEVRVSQGRSNDLYTRFFRMAERQVIERSGKGIICFISNYSWLDNLSDPGMREKYLDVFDQIWIDCLNGDKFSTGKSTPDGKSDPSIFSTTLNREGIEVGTAIAMLLRREPHNSVEQVYFRNFWGTTKHQQLTDLQNQALCSPLNNHLGCSEFLPWLPQSLKDDGYTRFTPALFLGLPFKPLSFSEQYSQYPLVSDIFPQYFPGIKTSRDVLVIDTDKEHLVERMRHYLDPSVSKKEMRHILQSTLSSSIKDKLLTLRSKYNNKGFQDSYVVKHHYRPFDMRWLYWETETDLLDRSRPDYLPHVTGQNIWLVSQQKSRRGWSKPLFIRSSGCLDLIDRGASYIPLALAPDPDGLDLWPNGERKLENGFFLNLSDQAVKYLKEIGSVADAESLFYHTLAVLHSSSYAEDNEGALQQDWARVPLPRHRDILLASAALGRNLAQLLDPDTPVIGVTKGKIRDELRVIALPSRQGGGQIDPRRELSLTSGWGRVYQEKTMPGKGKCNSRVYDSQELVEEASKDRLGKKTNDIYLNEVAYWRNIPDRVWNYTIGGYQVIKKWLSYREETVLGRSLRLEEVQEVTHIARRIAAILLLEPQLDANYQAVKRDPYPWSGESES